MSPTPRTYVGPFGRILPILPNIEPLASDQQHAPIEGTPSSKMATYQLPAPVGLQFGSDPFHGFGASSSHSSHIDRKSSPERPRPVLQDASRRNVREQLPSVRQLLTPGSQPGVPPSPTSSHHSPDPYDPGPGPLSSRRNTFQEPTSPIASYPPQGVFTTLPAPQQFTGNGYPARDTYQPVVHPPQFPTSYTNPFPPTSSTYNAYQGPPRQDQYTQQPRHIAPMIAPATDVSQYYHPPMSPYDASLGSMSNSGHNIRDASNNIKPLPRLVGESLIPGEGPCYLYDDGSACKKIIDGEPVNAQWGVTKAGKPRKRLAIACTTCREKKIKCDPADPKCVQCEKFGRVCRFQTA